MKSLKKIAPTALPILGSLIPGIGTVLGSALGGAAGGLVSGGGIKSALKGAALSGLTAGAANGFGGALGNAGTTINWTGGAPGQTLGREVVGGSGLLGALSRGGGFAQGVGSALGSVSSALKGTFGNPATEINWTGGAPGQTLGREMVGGSGLLGAASRSGLGSLATGSGGSGVGLGSLVRTGASLYSGMQEDDALKKAQRAQLDAMQPYQQIGLNAQQQLSGNLSEGFNPDDLQNDPGYQFRLNQGMDALNSQLAAQGMGQSGMALKAAQEYGQGFAGNEFGNAYNRWLQQNQQLGGLGAQGMSAAGDVGNVNAATFLAQGDAKNRRLAEILAGLGI